MTGRESDDYGGVPPSTRGYSGRYYHSQSSIPIHVAIPASEAGNTGCCSSSLVHTSHGSSSRPVGGEGYSGYSSSSHQPTYHMVCFECGYIRLFVRDCPRTKRWGIH